MRSARRRAPLEMGAPEPTGIRLKKWRFPRPHSEAGRMDHVSRWSQRPIHLRAGKQAKVAIPLHLEAYKGGQITLVRSPHRARRPDWAGPEFQSGLPTHES